MRPGISALQAWRPEEMAGAASGLARRVDEFDESLDGVRRASNVVTEWWKGQASDSARDRMGAEFAAGHRVAVAGLEVVEVLNSSMARLDEARQQALFLVVTLKFMGLSVGEDGQVSGRSADSANQADLARQLDAALARVDEADRQGAAELDQALSEFRDASEFEYDHSAARQAVLQRLGPIPGDAAGLNQFWQSLSTAERSALLAADPSLGARQGMPAVTRDFYNRETLEDLLSAAGAEHTRIEAEAANRRETMPTSGFFDAWPLVSEELAGARTRLAGYEAVAKTLADDPRALLMDIDSRGHAVVALNNPDTATHVTTLVPGTGSNLGGIEGDMNRTRAMLDVAEATSPNARHSVGLYLGSTMPQELPQAMDRGYAERGAEALRDYQSALRASHVGSDSHNTVVGHSYGSTTAAYAASRGHSLDADALVFLGSPGATVGSADELSLTGVDPAEIGDHVFATKARLDPVPLFANLGGIQNFVLDSAGAAAAYLIPGGSLLAPALDDVGDFAEKLGGPLGSDPTDTGKFGGQSFSSAPGTPNPYIIFSTDAHSEYWDHIDGKPGPSLANMGLIMSAQGREVY